MHDKGELLLRVQTLRQVQRSSHYEALLCRNHTTFFVSHLQSNFTLLSSNFVINGQGLSDWRTKLDGQVRNYQQEMNTLNTDLKTEVGQLRTEFNDLRSTLRQQMELTVSLAKGETKAEAATTTAQKQTA